MTRGNGWEDAGEGTEPAGAREPHAEGRPRLEEARPQSPLPGQVPAGAAATPWVLAAAGTGEPSLNFWSTLCEPEPCAGAARGGSVGFLMAGASHNRPGGRLGGSAGTVLLVGLAGQEQQLGG